MDYLIPILLFVGLGLLAGVLLTVFSRVFAVEQDERAVQVREALPGANCGACGYAGCDAYAEAVAKGARTNACIPGGDAVSRKLSAIMGTAYAKTMGVKNPRVGLVTNGTEDHKGDPLHQEANALLKTIQGINYVGNVEGRDIMSGDIDVAVCDGFSGNIALKTAEGTALAVMSVIKSNIKASF